LRGKNSRILFLINVIFTEAELMGEQKETEAAISVSDSVQSEGQFLCGCPLAHMLFLYLHGSGKNT
jgi:hypothetical protein